MSDSLRPHGVQHARLPCPSPTPWAYSNSHASSQWCHPTISSSVVPFSSCLQSFPVSGSLAVLHIRWPKYWHFGFSLSPSNEYSRLISFRIDWLGLLAVQESSPTPLKRINSLAFSFLYIQLSYSYMTTGKTIALTRWTFVGKIMSLLFNVLSRLVITFLPRCKHLLISWLHLTICSDFGAPKNKVSHCFHCFPIYLPWSDGTRCHDLSFLNVEF